MKIKDDSTICRPPPSAPHEEQIVVAVPIEVDAEHQQQDANLLSLSEQQEAHHATVAAATAINIEPHQVGDGDAAAAHAEAAAARAQGTNLIRNHLDHHLDQNPHSSYVTWIATLHPENADVVIDPRFLIPGNPWLSVYEDAMHRRSSRGGEPSSFSSTDVTPTSSTTVVVVDGSQEGHDDKNNHSCCGRQGFLDLIVGWSLTLAAVLTTFSLELVAMYFLFSIWLCFKLTSPDGGCFGPPINILTIIPCCVCYLLLGIFILMNAIVFFVSILMVEIIAGVNLLICTLFSLSCKVGLEHHQRTRRLAHLIRWAFRHRFEDLDPSVRGSTALDCCAGEDAALTSQLAQPGSE